MSLIWAPSASSGPSVYLHVDSQSYSEAVPIRGYFDHWDTPFFGGTGAFTYNWLEAGIASGAWRLGVLTRYDYYPRFNEDTAEFYYLVQNKKPLPLGRTYQLDLAVNHYSSSGLRGAYRWVFGRRLELELGVSYLQGNQLTEGRLRGEATAVADNDYDFQFDVDYRYGEDKLFDRRVRAPDGQGYSVDVRLAAQLTEQVLVELGITDLVAAIHWDDAPFTTAQATSDTKTFDDQGYVRFEPTLAGVEGNRDFRQRLPLRADMRVRYLYAAPWSTVADMHHTRNQTLVSVGVGRQFAWGVAEGLYEPETQALTLRISARRWRVGLTADQLEPGRVRRFGLNVAMLWGSVP